MSMVKQKGSSTVEFAMLVPLLLLLVVMVAEFGIQFYRLNAVTKSVQIAARYLSDVSTDTAGTNPTSYLNYADDAKKLAVYGNIAGTGDPIVTGFSPTDINITIPIAQHVQVVATYDSYLLLGSTLNTFTQMVTGGSTATDFMTLGASSVMRFAQ